MTDNETIQQVQHKNFAFVMKLHKEGGGRDAWFVIYKGQLFKPGQFYGRRHYFFLQAKSRGRFLRRFRSDLARSLRYLKNELGPT